MSVFVDKIEFVTETCCNCNMPFAMTREFKNKRLKDRQLFYCPAGHSQYYTGKSEEQKLREELERKKRDLEAESGRALILQNELNESKKITATMRTRIKNGVCPCCTRTFQNLFLHMKTEHPDFGENDNLKTIRSVFGLTQSALAKEIRVNASHISNFENGRGVSEFARRRIVNWMERQQS